MSLLVEYLMKTFIKALTGLGLFRELLAALRFLVELYRYLGSFSVGGSNRSSDLGRALGLGLQELEAREAWISAWLLSPT